MAKAKKIIAIRSTSVPVEEVETPAVDPVMQSIAVERTRLGHLGSTLDGVTNVRPYELEVRAWEKIYDLHEYNLSLEDELKDTMETLNRLRRMLGGRLPTDGTYSVEMIGHGAFVDELNVALQACASDVHRRPMVDEKRKVSAVIECEPSENSAAMKMAYKVSVSLAKSEGDGLAYIDKSGKLVPPEGMTADQIMLPLDHKAHEKRAAA